MKITTIIHGTELGKNFFTMDIILFRKIKKIIAVSNFTKSLIPKKIQIENHVINNGVDIDKWSLKMRNIH